MLGYAGTFATHELGLGQVGGELRKEFPDLILFELAQSDRFQTINFPEIVEA